MTLRTQLLASTSALLDQLPGVRDGGVEAIHDARVATRRIRALLPVLSVCYPQTDLKSTRSDHQKGRARAGSCSRPGCGDRAHHGARTNKPGRSRARSGGTPPDCGQAIDGSSTACQEVRRSATGGRDERRRPTAKEPLAFRPGRHAGVRRSNPRRRCATTPRHSATRSTMALASTFRNGRTASGSMRRSSATSSR